MPISFYHGFEAVEPASLTDYPEQVQRLLKYLDSLEEDGTDDAQHHQHVALRLETKLVRGKQTSAVAFRWTDDPSAPAVNVREEDVLKSILGHTENLLSAECMIAPGDLSDYRPHEPTRNSNPFHPQNPFSNQLRAKVIR